MADPVWRLKSTQILYENSKEIENYLKDNILFQYEAHKEKQIQYNTIVCHAIKVLVKI